MRKILYIFGFVILLTWSNNLFGQQTPYALDNNGGKIDNKGTLRIKSGQVNALPDTIKGRVEFINNEDSDTKIPNINYNQLVFFGKARKWTDSLSLFRPLVTEDSLIVSRNAWVQANFSGIYARASVFNNARIEGIKDVRLNAGIKAQDIFGNGSYTNLNIDNPLGVDIIQSGGFRINTKLELTIGELRNKADSNFIMADSTIIVRHVGGSLANDPQFGNSISVQYVGSGALQSGPELPSDTTKLLVLSSGDNVVATLTKNVTVNDSLYVGNRINTEVDTNNKFVLTLTSLKPPVFGGADAEISGSFRRTRLVFDSTKIIFNNPYTWALFKDSSSSGGIRQMTFRIKPRTFPPIINNDLKVQRALTLSAVDENYQPIVSGGVNVIIGYGWRHSIDTAKDETKTLRPDFNFLTLQRFKQGAWEDITTSIMPATIDSSKEWAYSYATQINELGDFAVGVGNNGRRLEISGKVLLEGPYRLGSMAMDLKLKNLIPATPPDIYPYNLDQNRLSYNVSPMPDSIVDYVVLEFRKTLTDSVRFHRTCLLKTSGQIVDFDGRSNVNLPRGGGLDTGTYHIAVLHRNHLAIITEDTVGIRSGRIGTFVDFTNQNILQGRANAVKPIDRLSDGSILFGMIAGDYNGDGKIDSTDFVRTWGDRDFENDYFIGDFNMTGIINTRDLNISWNNRNRETLLPK